MHLTQVWLWPRSFLVIGGNMNTGQCARAGGHWVAGKLEAVMR